MKHISNKTPSNINLHTTKNPPAIYLFIHYAIEAAQTYKIKHKVKTQSINNSKNTTQQRNQIQISTVWANTLHSAFLMMFSETEDTSISYLLHSGRNSW